MAHIFNISARKVGGLRFLKVGRLTVSFSVSRRDKLPKFKALPLVELTPTGYMPLVKLYLDGRMVREAAGPATFGTACGAMAHARAGIAACGMKLMRA